MTEGRQLAHLYSIYRRSIWSFYRDWDRRRQKCPNLSTCSDVGLREWPRIWSIVDSERWKGRSTRLYPEGRHRDQNGDRAVSLLCCIWDLDRLNITRDDRLVLMHQ